MAKQESEFFFRYGKNQKSDYQTCELRKDWRMKSDHTWFLHFCLISFSSPSSNFIFVSTSQPPSRFVFAKLSHIKTRYKKFLVKWNFFRRNEKKRRQDSHSMCWVVRWTTSQWFSPNISREDWFRCANIEFLVKVDICQVVVRFVSPYRFQFGHSVYYFPWIDIMKILTT